MQVNSHAKQRRIQGFNCYEHANMTAYHDNQAASATKGSALDTPDHSPENTESSEAPRPLRDSARDAIGHFLSQIDDQPYTDLYDMVIAQVEEPLLIEMMRHTNGNQSKASEMLGLNRGTLRKKLRRYGIIDPLSDT